MPRKKRASPSAATLGMKEVKAEERGDFKEAEKFGKLEANARTSSNSGRSRRRRDDRDVERSSVKSYDTKTVVDAVDVSGLSAMSKPILFTGHSGREYGTDTYADRVQTALPQVLFVALQNDPTGLGYDRGLQTLAGTLDTAVSGVIGAQLKGMYGNIVRSIQSKGRTVRDTFLDEPAGTQPAGSLCIWLNDWSAAYCTLVGMLHLLKHADFNIVARNISNAIEINLPRLEADLVKLMSYPVPPKWIRMLDKVTGPKFWDHNGPLYFIMPGADSAGTALDMTLSATIVTLLGVAETNLSVLDTYFNNSPDMIRISNTFGIAYGRDRAVIPTSKGPVNDPTSVAMILGQAVTNADSTAVKLFTYPNINATNKGGGTIGSQIPMWLPPDATDADLFLSLLRTVVYSVDAIAGIAGAVVPDQVGLFFNYSGLATTGTVFGSYDQTFAFSSHSYTHAGPVTVAEDDATTAMFWAYEAQNEATAYKTAVDKHDLVRVNVQVNRLLDETVLMLEDIFIGSVNV